MEASEAELNSRFPLSMAQWHAHTNICVPQNLENYDSLASDLRFGFEGSIDARAECSAAGGMFYPDVLGWMVHVNFADFPFTSR